MRLLLFSDLHLDRPFVWAGPDGGRKRRRALRQTLARICDLAVALNVDALCCGGDLYEDEHKTLDTGHFVRDAFARLRPLPIYLAPGNHDWLGPASLYRRMEWTDNVHIFQEPRLCPLILADGFTLWGAAHCQPAQKTNLLDDFRAEGRGVHLGLFHGSEQRLLAHQGEKVGHAPFRAEQIGVAGLSHALLGHYHTPRDTPDFTYPGNPDPLEFGEEGERAAVLVTVATDGSVRTERHPVAGSSVADVDVCLDGAAHFEDVCRRVAERVAALQGVVRVTLVGELAQDVDIDLPVLAQVAPHLDALVPRLGALGTAYDLEMLAREQTVRGRFVRNVQGAPDLAAADRRRILITGLRAFAGREDLEVH